MNSIWARLHYSEKKSPDLSFIPPLLDSESVPGFNNTKEHFEIYLEVRKNICEELTYRRDRQLEINKWASTTLLAITAGLFTFASRGAVDIPLAYKLILTLIVTTIALIAVFRVAHDACQMAVYSSYVHDLDKKFGLNVRDGKPLVRFIEWCPLDKGNYDFTERDHMALPEWRNSLVLSYFIWIASMWFSAVCAICHLPSK